MSIKSQTGRKVEFVLIAWRWGAESFTFISQPPIVRAKIRGEEQVGRVEELKNPPPRFQFPDWKCRVLVDINATRGKNIQCRKYIVKSEEYTVKIIHNLIFF